MRQDGTHFRLSALSNEDHVAKQPSVSVHENLLGFSFGWFTLHCSEGFNFIFLMGSWKQFPFCIVRIPCRHVLLSHALPTSQWIHQETQLSQWKCSRGRKDRIHKGLSNCFPRDRPLKQRPTHLSLCGSFKDQCAL